MPPKRTRTDAAAEGDAPEAVRPAKKVKVTKDNAKPPAKKATSKAKSATQKTTANTAKKLATRKAAPQKAPAKKAAPKKAPSTKSASVPPASAPTMNGAAVKPATKASRQSTPKQPVVEKKVDPMDIIYAEPKPALKKLPAKKVINEAAFTRPLDIFVCGEGSNAELGLGTARNQTDVKRPRFNAFVSSKEPVRIATGGMHVLALCKDGNVYSWGVNDQGALGRDTRWEGGLRDMDMDSDDSDDEDSDSGMNPHEANPAAIDSKFFHPGSVIIDVAAGDSCSFALTAEGRVYGWGTFRSNEGILGFSREIDVQRTPYVLKSLKNIKKIAAGTNHVLALDDKGVVWAWGSGQQSQLGRRIIERKQREGLIPGPAVIKRNENDRRSIKAVDIGCGAYSSFAIDQDGNVWSWGANNYGECGHFANAGEDRAIQMWPAMVEDLEKDGKPRQITQIQGGAHHTVAVASDGECLVWGRCDGGQTGIPLSQLNKEHVITNTGLRASEVKTEDGEVPTRTYKILAYPTAIPAVGSTAIHASCGSDHTIIITDKGKAWTSGFSANYQTGQGTDEDIEDATMIDNTATRNRKLIWAGAGGQYSLFAAEKEETISDVKMNGV